MADVYSAIILDDDYWDGTESWAGETTEGNRDTKYSTRRFTSLSGWESDRDGNGSAGDTEIATIIGPWASHDTTMASCTDFQGDGVKIQCPITLPDGANAARHDGIYGNKANSYILENSTDYCLKFYDEALVNSVDGIQMYCSVDSGKACIYTAGASTGGTLTIENCVIKSDTKGLYSNNANSDVWVINCVIESNEYAICYSANQWYIYNCTITTINVEIGIRTSVDGTDHKVRNTVSFNTSDDFYNITDIDYCASDDGNGTNAVDWDSGATDWAANFTDYSNGDFTPLDDDLPGAGVGPSSDSDVPTTDIIGNTRSGSTCTIGAFEYQAAGGTTLVVAEADSAGTIDNVALTQAHALQVQALSGAGAIDNVSLTQAHLLAAQPLLSSGTIDNVNLILAKTLSIAELLTSGTIDNVELIQKHILSVNSLLASETIDNVEVSIAETLSIAEALSAGTIDNVELIQKHALSVDDLSSSGALDNVTLSLSGIYYLRADGVAANKEAATSPNAAATSMSIATHNSETFAAGDTIRLSDQGGTFRDELIFPSSGSVGNVITYEAVSGESPVISSADVNSSWTRVRDDVGFDVWEGGPGTGDAEYLFARDDGASDRNPYHNGAYNTWANYTIDRMFCGSRGNGNYYIRTDGENQDPGIVEIGIRDSCIDVNGQDYITIKDISAHGPNGVPTGGWSQYQDYGLINIDGSATYITLDNVDIKYGGVGVRISSPDISNITIQNQSLISRCWQGIFVYNGDYDSDRNVLIQDIEVGNIAEVYDETNGDRASIGSLNARGVRVRNCYIHDQGSADMGGDRIDAAINFAGGQDIEVTRCLIKDVARGGIIIANAVVETIQDALIQYNIVDNWAAFPLDAANKNHSGIRIGGSGAGATYDDIRIYNNVLTNASAPGAGSNHSGVFVSMVGQTETNLFIKNNLTNNLDNMDYEFRVNGGSYINYEIENNCFYQSGSAYLSIWGSDDDVAGLNALHANFSNNIDTDPDLDADYHLGASSTCDDAGADLGASYDDGLGEDTIWGTSVAVVDQDDYGAGWDIGAFIAGSGTGSTVLVVQAALSPGTIDNIVLAQKYTLIIDALLSGGLLDNVVLGLSEVLVVAELLTSGTIDNVVLGLSEVLVVAELLTSGTIDNVNMGGAIFTEAQYAEIRRIHRNAMIVDGYF